MVKAINIRLEGRVAIVTGAANGLGRAMALGLISAGANVVFADLDVESAENVVRSLNSQPTCGKPLALRCDIADRASCDQVVLEALSAFGSVDILVNNAGKGPAYLEHAPDYRGGSFWETDPARWADVVTTNVIGSYFMARAAAPHMVNCGWGRIVNITTSLFTMQRRENSPYGVSKAAIETETLIWAQDLNATGVTCNSLIPGEAVDTAFVSKLARKAITKAGRTLLEPEVMVPPLLWLSSSMSNGVTGKRFVARHWKPEMAVDDAAEAALEAPVLRSPC